ncbi:hypothetical protein KDH_30780 [Dictyobacter sp. S3.2.2.5]|uniref:Uncharacterized protein n=1 Tax=Dictyobacter halimunensis TaxID=3026934 RepID=A0ABQ6FPT5_9CHLR|nr:hypothetical protein KDH_30780 [Dictyobacter sp. S3.2.2.5]
MYVVSLDVSFEGMLECKGVSQRIGSSYLHAEVSTSITEMAAGID